MRRALLLVAPLLVLVAPGVAAALDGDAPSAVGWWSRDPAATEQPAGGFQVAAAGGQAVSIAALRFTVPDGASTATLHLQEADGGMVSPATTVQACPTADPWEPANPGAFDDAPAPDCTTPIELTRDETDLTWSGSVPPAAAGSLVIVPGPPPEGGAPVDPGFQLTFTGARLDVVAASAGGAAPAPSPAAWSPPPASPSSSPSSSAGFTGGGSSTFAAPGPVTPPTTATTVAATTATTVAQGTDEQAFRATGGGASGGGGASQPWARLLVLVPLSAIAGVAFVYARRILRQRGVLEEA